MSKPALALYLVQSTEGVKLICTRRLPPLRSSDNSGNECATFIGIAAQQYDEGDILYEQSFSSQQGASQFKPYLRRASDSLLHFEESLEEHGDSYDAIDV